MSKKGENIRKRKDGRWEARYEKGRRPDGSICYGYIYAHRYSDVKEKRNQMIGMREATSISLSEDPEETPEIDLNDIFDEWEADIRYSVKDSSYFFYKILLDHHLRPEFGSLRLCELTGSRLQNFINRKVEDNFSASYVNSMALLLQNILKFALNRQYLMPPLPAFHPPHISKQIPAIFSFQEWQALESYLKKQSDDFSFGILLCMHTGLRLGELSGLQWGDFDLERHQFMIRRTVYRMKNKNFVPGQTDKKTVLCIETPKTPSSVRDIPLSSYFIEHLPLHIKNAEEFVLTGSSCCMEPRNIQRKFKHLLEKCGLPYLNFHSLRHGFATYGIQKGIDYKTMSEILGHASVTTTLKVYVHSNMEHKRKCLELLMN